MISLSISRKYTGYERRRFKFLCEANAQSRLDRTRGAKVKQVFTEARAKQPTAAKIFEEYLDGRLLNGPVQLWPAAEN